MAQMRLQRRQSKKPADTLITLQWRSRQIAFTGERQPSKGIALFSTLCQEGLHLLPSPLVLLQPFEQRSHFKTMTNALQRKGQFWRWLMVLRLNRCHINPTLRCTTWKIIRRNPLRITSMQKNVVLIPKCLKRSQPISNLERGIQAQILGGQTFHL